MGRVLEVYVMVDSIYSGVDIFFTCGEFIFYWLMGEYWKVMLWLVNFIYSGVDICFSHVVNLNSTGLERYIFTCREFIVDFKY